MIAVNVPLIYWLEEIRRLTEVNEWFHKGSRKGNITLVFSKEAVGINQAPNPLWKLSGSFGGISKALNF